MSLTEAIDTKAIETKGSSTTEILLAARQIADYANAEGVLRGQNVSRGACKHLGAVLADSVLQAGLNYTTVVQPRVLTILQTYPDMDTVSALLRLIEERMTSLFLNWQHHEKITRFELLVAFLNEWDIDDFQDLRTHLVSEQFCDAIKGVRGIGPKTVDYMSCLVGIDSIAVDRHVRTFAQMVGVQSDDYYFLRKSFCCAADLLALPRRDFDAWLWKRGASRSAVQLSLSI